MSRQTRVIIAASFILPAVFAVFFLLSPNSNTPANADIKAMRQPYLDFIDLVFTRMEEDYFKPVSREIYKSFIENYKRSHLSDPRTLMDDTGWLAHLGAGLLVQEIKDPDDTFTNFVPPKEAEEYARTIYGYQHGLGISGDLIENAFLITEVEIRSDAYEKGIRPGNVIMAINGIGVENMTQEEINSFLYPPLDTEVNLIVAIIDERRLENYVLVCREFFTETVEDIPTGIPGVYYFRINRFNRETADDLKNMISGHGPANIRYMILDVTDNPGGPPLAVREMASIFLNPGDQLFYYMKRNEPQFGLVTPPSDVRYTGRLMILVDGNSGSSSELLAGTLKAHRRAIVMGPGNTAGSASLKGAVRFEDGSMLALITGQSYLFDGTLVGHQGVEPDYIIPPTVTDIRAFALEQIMLSMQTGAPQE